MFFQEFGSKSSGLVFIRSFSDKKEQTACRMDGVPLGLFSHFSPIPPGRSLFIFVEINIELEKKKN